MDVPAANVSMTGFEMCTLLMHVVTDELVDKYDCSHDCVPTDPKKLVKELTQIETRLKSSSKTASGLRTRGQTGPPSESRNPKDKHHKSKGNGMGMTNPIPRKAPKPSRDTGMLCGLSTTYGGAVKSHITSDCKKVDMCRQGPL